MRIKWIDSAKGIAMLCVILGHMNLKFTDTWNYSFVFAFHLTVFFILSGYTMKVKPVTSGFVNDKFKRLMVPYFYTCFFVALMDVFNNVHWDQDGSIQSVTQILGKDMIRFFFASGTYTTFGEVDAGGRIGAIWFLPAMFFGILIAQWVLSYTKSHLKRWAIVGGLALAGYLLARFIWLPFSIQSGTTAALFILLGYYMKEYHVMERVNWKHLILCGVIYALGYYKSYTQVYFVVDQYEDILISGMVAVASSILVIRLAMVAQKSRFLSFVGKNSMYYMCTHLFALEAMWPYFYDYGERLGLQENGFYWVLFLQHIVFTTVATLVILGLKKVFSKDGLCLPSSGKKLGFQRLEGSRDQSVDVMKGILIVSMLVGHFSIDPTLRAIIYSCHMVAFVFLSGYFYKGGGALGRKIVKLMKAFLLPYCGFCVVGLLLQWKTLTPEALASAVKTYVLGMSFGDKILGDVPSIGPVYFILLLFVVRLVYLLVDRVVQKESHKLVAVVVLSLAGMWLGEHGYWLPWSLDIALYGLIFYQLAIYCYKYKVLEKLRENCVAYFLLASVWAYMIYKGSMEVALRLYRPYGLVIVGAMGGILLIYLASGHIQNHTLPIFGKVLSALGEHTLYILIVHTLVGSYIYSWLGQRFDSAYIYHMVACLIIQLALGVLVGVVVKRIKLATGVKHGGTRS